MAGFVLEFGDVVGRFFSRRVIIREALRRVF